jgi:hypothetical protein
VIFCDFFVYSSVTQLLEKNMQDHPVRQNRLDCPSPEDSSPECEGKSLAPPAFQLMASSGEDGLPVQRKESHGGSGGVIQKKDVPTNFGTFKTPRLEKFNETGVKCWLDFEPNEKKVDATKIGLTQAVKGTYKDGSHTGLDPGMEGRRVKSGPGKDFHIDRADSNNPVYGSYDLQNGEGLEKTRKDTNYNQEPTKVGPDEEGGNSTYELGHAYSDKSGKKKKTAKMYDRPNGGAGMEFETTALALEGTQKNQYYGSVKWGFEVRDGKVVPQDIELVSMGDPSANFVEAAKLWNKAKTQGTLEVVANPAKAFRYGSMAAKDIPKGTRCKENQLGMVNDQPTPLMELLDATGKGTGELYYIHTNDLKDLGDGKDTADLPVRKSNWFGETDLDGTVELPPAKEKHWWGDED